MRGFLFILLFFIHFQDFAQNVKGVVVDYNSKEPISNAHIQINNLQLVSKKEGSFSFTLPEDNFEIRVTHIGYDTLLMLIDPLKIGKGKNIKIELKTKNYLLDPSVILSERLPDTIFQSKMVSVSDFLFVEGQLLLLTYEKTIKKGSALWWVDEERNPVSKYPVPGVAIELVYNYKKEPILICEETVYEIKTNKGYIELYEIPSSDYYDYVEPVLSEKEEDFIFTTFNAYYPAFKYMAYNQIDSTYLDLIQIEDEFMMEHYLAEYKFVDTRTKLWAYNQQLQTGIDKEIWVGATVFTQTPYYKELYAPLFLRNDTIFIFDYYKEQLFLLDDEYQKIDSLPIEYHMSPKKSGWKRAMVQDEANGKVYAVFENYGYTLLKEIDLTTGKPINLTKLYFKYVERIRVFDGKVYYIYRPFESLQKKFLYQEFIND